MQTDETQVRQLLKEPLLSYNTTQAWGERGPGWGEGGQPPPNNLRGGPTYPLHPSANNPPTFSFNFYLQQEKITKFKYQAEG